MIKTSIEENKVCYTFTDEEFDFTKQLKQFQYNKGRQREVKAGKRIGLYSFEREIGRGNFSQVVTAVHDITKGSVGFTYIRNY